MNYVSGFAVYFILWWVVLFAILPFSLRTQDEEGETVLGTVPSAPRGAHMLRAMLRTTIVSLAIYAVFFVLTRHYGLGADDLPHIVPNFR